MRVVNECFIVSNYNIRVWSCAAFVACARSLHKPETRVQDGDEALVCAAANDSTDCVRLLLNSGALIDSHVRGTIRVVCVIILSRSI
jgi:hypothetical protein